MTSSYDKWLDEGLDEYMGANDIEEEDPNIICPYCDHDFYTEEIEDIQCPECERLILL
jgi:Zn finger protein HypA/HybF involved in hydrogenase expression